MEICERYSMIESLVIFLVFSKKYTQIAAIIANKIADISLDTSNINQTMIHKKLAFAIVCQICTSLLITM
jgi:predicted amino acid-binding ACT domain protein